VSRTSIKVPNITEMAMTHGLITGLSVIRFCRYAPNRCCLFLFAIGILPCCLLLGAWSAAQLLCSS
jgi:hypothetical protein